MDVPESDVEAVVEVAVHRAKGLCGWEWSGYPHPGCAEFSEPDRAVCDEKATHIVVIFERTPGYDGLASEQYCAEHAQEQEENPPDEFSRVVTVRPIDA